jgi:hypothetical protein
VRFPDFASFYVTKRSGTSTRTVLAHGGCNARFNAVLKALEVAVSPRFERPDRRARKSPEHLIEHAGTTARIEGTERHRWVVGVVDMMRKVESSSGSASIMP